MSGTRLEPADLARLRQATHLLDLHDRDGAKALVADWSLARSVPALGAWLDGERVSGLPADADDPLSCILRGWARYYRAEYAAAAASFACAVDAGLVWGAWASLGLGKVCSDLGHWTRARHWLAVALTQARAEGDLARMAECLGALGEVFVRAGRPRVALELFDADAALLPPGSGHRLRLQNYRAIALRRLGRIDLAVPLLWEAVFTALPRDPHSALFSLASLSVCALRSADAGLHERVRRVRDDHAGVLEPLVAKAPMPEAARRLCDAAWAWGTGEAPGSGASAALEDTVRLLAEWYPFEHLWVETLAAVGDSSMRQERWTALAARDAGPAPAGRRVGAVDCWMLDVPLGAQGLLGTARRVLEAGDSGPEVIRAGLGLWFV